MKLKKLLIIFTALITGFSGCAKPKQTDSLKPETIIRPPILRMTGNGYRLIWNDNSEKPQTVTLYKKGENPQILTPRKTSVNYKNSGYYVNFENLEPGEAYFYQISGQGKVKFYAPKSKDKEVNFTVISDHQTYPEITKKGFNSVKKENPDFILSCGDMLEDGKLENWNENFFKKISIFEGIPFAASQGNNDTGKNLFLNYLGLKRRYYSVKYGCLKIYILDSNLPMGKDSKQYKWLSQKLTHHKNGWNIVVYHHGSYVSTEPDLSSTKYREDLCSLLKMNDVHLVLNGHNHIYDRTTPINGITYVTVPTLSGKPNKVKVNKESGYYANNLQNFYGYINFTATQNKITGTVKNLDGNQLDSFEITK